VGVGVVGGVVAGSASGCGPRILFQTHAIAPPIKSHFSSFISNSFPLTPGTYPFRRR
jgi:hypothetical protein